MFPIVPQNFVVRHCNFESPEAISNFINGSSKLLVPGKVTATSAIAQGAVSEPIDPEDLLGQPDIVQISARTNNSGLIELDSKSKEIWNFENHWIRAIRLSEDCHTFNVQLQFENSENISNNNDESRSPLSNEEPSRKLILKAVRAIELNQEILLWFSDEILALLQVTFLSPTNIQGQNRYVCTKCSALYESPNPLKLHIALSCGRLPIKCLWEKLANSFKSNQVEALKSKELFDFKLNLEESQRNAMDLSVPQRPLTSSSSSDLLPPKILYRPYSEVSAFKPFQKCNHQSIQNNLLAPMENVQIWPMVPSDHHHQHCNFNNFEFPVRHHQQELQQPMEASEDTEGSIETLVSSLGKSKQGHICLYCGKCYSRKYGLKIHIRTHTGYKPLKCKFCLRPFGDPSNLNKHVRLHAEGNTPYKCDLCGKVLVRRRDLDRHLKSRHMVEIHPGTNLIQEDSNSEDVKLSGNEDQI